MSIPARVERLDPCDRLRFDEEPIRRWRVTWADGKTEIVEGHMAMREAENVMTFAYYFLGAHRVINVAHVRDVEELD